MAVKFVKVQKTASQVFAYMEFQKDPSTGNVEAITAFFDGATKVVSASISAGDADEGEGNIDEYGNAILQSDLADESDVTDTNKEDPMDAIFPSHNPLHKDSLCKDDLVEGMAIYICSSEGEQEEWEIIGRPYVDRTTGYSFYRIRAKRWGNGDKIQERALDLREIGVEPYQSAPGKYFWNSECYTIEA